MNYVALLGWSPQGDIAEQEFFTMEQLVDAFDIAGISKSPAIFDMGKLDSLQRQLSPGHDPRGLRQGRRALYPPDGEEPGAGRRRHRRPASGPVRKAHRYSGEGGLLRPALPEYDAELFTNKKSKTNSEVSLDMLEKTAPVLADLADWTQDSIHDALIGLAEQLGVKNATLMWPLRIAAAGKARHPRRRGGDLPHSGPGRDPPPDADRHGKIEIIVEIVIRFRH